MLCIFSVTTYFEGGWRTVFLSLEFTACTGDRNAVHAFGHHEHHVCRQVPWCLISVLAFRHFCSPCWGKNWACLFKNVQVGFSFLLVQNNSLCKNKTHVNEKKILNEVPTCNVTLHFLVWFSAWSDACAEVSFHSLFTCLVLQCNCTSPAVIGYVSF